MRTLITGAGGFVAPFVGASFKALFGQDCEIAYAGHRGSLPPDGPLSRTFDVTDAAAVDLAISELAPSHVVHLAGVSSLAEASVDPDLAWRVNVRGALNVAHALLRRAPDALLIFAGSGQVYGETAKSGRALTESDLLRPTSDYAVTKAAADLALGALASKGLRCARFRPFNHTGPGQSEDFVLPSFAGQIARIEAGRQPPMIRVGNLDAERDFLDVRDVADAYALVARHGAPSAPEAIFNIASGTPRRIGDLLEEMIAMSHASIRIEQDPKRMRPSETPRFYGDATRARALLGWTPSREIRATLADLLAAARRRYVR